MREAVKTWVRFPAGPLTQREVDMFGLGPVEVAMVGLVLILLFGKRLPGVMRSLGKSITEFKKGINDDES
jgi:sec-independent protein translocase protein TatA